MVTFLEKICCRFLKSYDSLFASQEISNSRMKEDGMKIVKSSLLTVGALALLVALAGVADAATTSLMFSIRPAKLVESTRVELVAEDGSTQVVESTEATFHVTPDAGPGKYRVTITVGDVSETSEVEVLTGTQVLVAFQIDAPADRISVQKVAGFGEIMVTAQKRDEALQDVPISVTAISNEVMQDFQIKNFQDYLRLVPGLSTSNQTTTGNAGPRAIGLRGIQSVSGSYLAGQNTVGFYIDDTPVPIADPRLVDLARVEVLRGPQGTLYGASALAGAVRVITERPSFDTAQAMVTARYSSTDYGGSSPAVEALVNIPVSEHFAMRLSGYYEDLAGFIDQHQMDLYGNPTGEILEDANVQTTSGGRLVMAWRPRDNFEITGMVMGERMTLDNNSYFTAPSPGGGPALDSVFGQLFNQLGIGAPNYGPVDGDPNAPYEDPIVLGHMLTPSETEYLLGSVRFQWQISDNVELISNFSEWDDAYHTVLDGTEAFTYYADQGPFLMEADYNTENSDFTNETRIQSTWDRRFQFTVGFFYHDRDEYYYTRFPSPLGTTYFGGLPDTPDGYTFWSDSQRLRKEMALFGQVSYDLSDRWRIALGARAFKFDFSSWDHFRGNWLFVDNGETFIEAETDASDWVPSLNLQFRPAPETLLYAAASEGFRMGGTNFPLPDTDACRAEVLARTGLEEIPAGYDSDSLWNYELGLKKGLANGRVTTNVAAFYMDWDQTQVATGSLCQLNGEVINVGSVKSQGFEVELQAAVTTGLTVGVNAAYVDAVIQEDYAPPGSTLPPIAVKGQALPDIPKWSWNILGQGIFPISGAVQGFVRGDYSHRDERVSYFSYAPQYAGIRADAYDLLNLRTGVYWEHWEFAIFMENVTNELPSLLGRSGLASSQGFRPLDLTLRPRTVGATAIWRF